MSRCLVEGVSCRWWPILVLLGFSIQHTIALRQCHHRANRAACCPRFSHQCQNPHCICQARSNPCACLFPSRVTAECLPSPCMQRHNVAPSSPTSLGASRRSWRRSWRCSWSRSPQPLRPSLTSRRRLATRMEGLLGWGLDILIPCCIKCMLLGAVPLQSRCASLIFLVWPPTPTVPPGDPFPALSTTSSRPLAPLPAWTWALGRTPGATWLQSLDVAALARQPISRRLGVLNTLSDLLTRLKYQLKVTGGTWRGWRSCTGG